MSIEPSSDHAGTDLANTLRQLRKAAGLSGERLAARCNMSQTKISRIENGRILPGVVDVERVLTALEVPTDAGNELLALARRANVGHTSWRSLAELGMWRKQDELKAVAESSTMMRHFLPAMPSGLLHVPEYARYALSPKVSTDPVRDVDKAVEARLNRQTVLADESRAFVFLMTEQAVKWKRAPRNVMVEQCAHMATLSDSPNVDIAVIPASAEVHGAPMNSYVIYDDRLVIAELFSGEVTLRDYKDVSYHRDLFEFFYDRALTGDRAKALLLAARDEFM